MREAIEFAAVCKTDGRDSELKQNVRNRNLYQDAEVLGYLPYPPPAGYLPPVSQKVGLERRAFLKFIFFRPFFRVPKFF